MKIQNTQKARSAAERKRNQRDRDREELEINYYTLPLTPEELQDLSAYFKARYHHDWSPTSRRAYRAPLPVEPRTGPDGQVEFLPPPRPSPRPPTPRPPTP